MSRGDRGNPAERRRKAGRSHSGDGGGNRLVLIAGLIFVVAWALRLIYVAHLRGSPLAEFPVLDELYHVEWA
ncbi:MAG TPA: hypothetical protein VE960_03280, partial [bacterium]|nr:hypothetical protein [bacterium]